MGFSLNSSAEPTTAATANPTTALPTTTTPVPADTVSAAPVTTTIAENPYPDALPLKEPFNYSSGKTASQGTVYRYWLNDSYQLYVPDETRYETISPAHGNRYLILFVNTVNLGTARNLPLNPGNIVVHYDGKNYYMDKNHVLPKNEQNVDSPADLYRIKEIEFIHKLFGSEYVEDFGYSHGMVLAYLLPGESNAIDGYIIFEVPASLDPARTYVEIPFNSEDVAVWKLV
jgi:hypothetical protein